MVFLINIQMAKTENLKINQPGSSSMIVFR